jgi:hypothetical protein
MMIQMAAAMNSNGSKSNRPPGPCARTTLIRCPFPSTPTINIYCTAKAMAYPHKQGVGHAIVR